MHVRWGEKSFPSVKYLYNPPGTFVYCEFFPKHAHLPANTFTATHFYEHSNKTLTCRNQTVFQIGSCWHGLCYYIKAYGALPMLIQRVLSLNYPEQFSHRIGIAAAGEALKEIVLNFVCGEPHGKGR